MDLADYASTTRVGVKHRRRCMTCALDDEVVKQIHLGREAAPKIPFPTIAKWLEDEHGIKIQPNTIRNHFVAGHQDD